MKKIAAVAVVAALLAAVLAVAAFKAGFFDSAEAEKPAAPKDIEKNVKVPVKTMRMHNVRIPSKEQLDEAVRKMKEKKKKEPASDKKSESCGE